MYRSCRFSRHRPQNSELELSGRALRKGTDTQGFLQVDAVLLIACQNRAVDGCSSVCIVSGQFLEACVSKHSPLARPKWTQQVIRLESDSSRTTPRLMNSASRGMLEMAPLTLDRSSRLPQSTPFPTWATHQR